LRGETVWCQGFSEPASGSDLASLSCKGVIDGDEIVVTGSKIWTSYAHLADYQELLVRTEPDSQRHGGISWVICDMHAPGITVTPIPFVNGVHHFNQVFYDEVRIPIRNVVGELNGGWKVAMATLSFERGTAFTQSQVELAMMVDELIERAQTRTRPDGKPGFGDMELGRRLSMLRAETAALRAMTYAAVSRNLRREQPGPDGSLLKVQLTRLKLEAEAISFELLGPHQAIRSLVTDKYLHNFASGVGGGTDEIQKNIIAQRVLGLPRSY
jgi:alkylation response protein AidB-like acyl-CoA dehydrogenase